jgi:hypothetical protein
MRDPKPAAEFGAGYARYNYSLGIDDITLMTEIE